MAHYESLSQWKRTVSTHLEVVGSSYTTALAESFMGRYWSLFVHREHGFAHSLVYILALLASWRFNAYLCESIPVRAISCVSFCFASSGRNDA